MSNKNNGISSSSENEKLLIISLNDENSKKILQTISNDTARKILEVIASMPLSASEIAEKLHIPLSTVQYNLEKLNEAGLVKVERTKYSEKMKIMKIYAAQRKFVVVTTEDMSKKSIVAALKKYLVLIFFAIAGAGIIELSTGKIKTILLGKSIKPIPAEEIPSSIPVPTPVSPVIYGFDIFIHPSLWFLFGCLFVILVVSLIEYFENKRKA